MKQKQKTKNNTNTKIKILKESEILFSKNGFDGTGINEIAKNTGIAKSVIYYHFKNKDDILKTMIDNFLNESINRTISKKVSGDFSNLDKLINEMLDFLEEKKLIIKIIIMQSIKEKNKIPLFKILTKLFDTTNVINDCKINKNDLQTLLIQEFFMIYIPIINYIIFQDKWSDKYKINKNKIKNKFIVILSTYFKQVYLPIICR